METQGWLVDLDGTLYSARPVKLLMGLELLLLGLPQLGRIKAFRREHERLRESQVDCQGDPFARQLERAAAGLGCTADELEVVVRHWMVERPCRWIRRFRNKSLLEEICAFRATGGQCALVSDYPALQKLKALEARDLFDVIVANGEPGGPSQLKPDPAGYLEAARQLGLPPEACLVLGDRLDADGAAARAAGIPFRQI